MNRKIYCINKLDILNQITKKYMNENYVKQIRMVNERNNQKKEYICHIHKRYFENKKICFQNEINN